MQILIIAAIIASIDCQAATLTCTFSGTECTNPIITAITAANQPITVAGQPETYTDTTINRFSFQSPNVMNYVPTDLFRTFPNQLFFGMNNCQLTNLVTNAFTNCNQLQTISIGSNNFSTIPAGFAQSCVNVETLLLINNKIQTIHVDAFKGLAVLQLLYLTKNSITCIPPELFSNTPIIKNIDFSINQITAIDRKTFTNLTSLYYISLESTQLKYLPNFDLTNTGYSAPGFNMAIGIETLDAIHPNLIPSLFTRLNTTIIAFQHPETSVNFGCISQQRTVITIDNWSNLNNTLDACYANWTTALENTPVSCATEIITTTTTTTTTTIAPPGYSPAPQPVCRYYLDYMNRYTCVLDNVTGGFTFIGGVHVDARFTDLNVTRIYIINSFLITIPAALFTQYPNLSFLSIANCSISVITDTTISQCGNLVFLDASFNKIVHISENAFSSCTKLEAIDLSGNPFEYWSIVASMVKLKKIFVNHPPTFGFC